MPSLLSKQNENKSRSTVFIIDDDRALQQGLETLLRSVGHDVEIVYCASEFLKTIVPNTAGCVVLDICVPSLSGLGLQEELAAKGIYIPIVFTTGHGDIPTAVSAMRRGAIDFLEKPFSDEDILNAVGRALEKDQGRWAQEEARGNVTSAYRGLTLRERDVMAHVVRGLMNKQVAAELGLSEITVKQHRGRVMKKMGLRTLADLVRASEVVRT